MNEQMVTLINAMDEVTLRVGGMVCARCIDVVRTELTRLGFQVTDLQLGWVKLLGSLRPGDLERIESALTQQGFRLIDDQNQTRSGVTVSRMTVHKRVKTFLDLFFASDDLSEPKARLSVRLQHELGLDYDTISGQFTKAEGITLEKYIINRRIDKVKERLVYSDETLTEIAYRTGYSSVQHLSNQFRQQTGLTPTYFRQVRQQKKALQQHAVNADKSHKPAG